MLLNREVGILHPQRKFVNIWRHFFIILTWKAVLLLASSWLGPGMLLNVMQCTGQVCTKNYLAQNVNSADIEGP